MKRKWAQGIAVNANFRALRARIISNLGDKERERLTREAASAKTAKEKTLTAGKRDTHKASEREISAIVAAYRTGQEVRHGSIHGPQLLTAAMYVFNHRDCLCGRWSVQASKDLASKL